MAEPRMGGTGSLVLGVPWDKAGNQLPGSHLFTALNYQWPVHRCRNTGWRWECQNGCCSGWL